MCFKDEAVQFREFEQGMKSEAETIRSAGLSKALAICLLGVMACEVLYLASGIQAVGVIARVLVLLVVLGSLTRIGLREVYLLSVCSGLSLLIALSHETPIEALTTCLKQAAFLMAFMLLIGLLQQGAQTSKAVLDCGRYLTSQLPGRRFFALFTGTHFMALLFNLGVISLIAPLIKQGARAANDGFGDLRERRQISAMLQGFAWSITWSPTAVGPLVLMTFLPEVQRGPWMLVGGALAVLVMLIGWGEDRLRGRIARPSAVIARVAPVYPKQAVLGFFGVCLALLCLSVLAMWLADQSIVFGLMVASPIVLVGWLIAQHQGEHGAALAQIRHIAFDYMPSAAPLAVTLACSGYIGRAAAALIPAEAWAQAIGLETMPGWLFLFSLTLAITVLSQFALSPIMMAVFFGSILSELSSLPADVTWAALAISCGWAISMTISPFATTVLMTQLAAHLSSHERYLMYQHIYPCPEFGICCC